MDTQSPLPRCCDINLLIAASKALTLLEAWRVGDTTTVNELRAEFAANYGAGEAEVGKLIMWLVTKGF